MNPAKANAISDEIFRTPVIAEIFARAFETLIYDREVVPYFRGVHDYFEARRASEAFIDFKRHLASQLEMAARLARMDPPASVADFALAESDWPVLRDQFCETLTTAGEAVFPLFLSLLEGIDAGVGDVILRAYQHESAGATRGISLDAGLAIPLPWWTGRTTHQNRPPRHAINGNYLSLESYFERLTVPLPRAKTSPTPVLHQKSAQSWAGERGALPTRDTMTVATIDLVTDPSELDLECESGRFWVPGFTRPEEIEDRLNWVLQQLEAMPEFRIDLLVFPELVANARVLEQIEAFVDRSPEAPIAVVGSVHEPLPPRESVRQSFRNRPYVIRPRERLDWDYWKLEQVEYLGQNEALGEPPASVVAIDTPIGRLCPLICKDLLTPDPKQAVIASRANLVVVPALTRWTSMTEFQSKARELAASNRAITIVANASIEARMNFDDPRARESPLAFVHPNVACPPEACPRHLLPDPTAEIVLAIYEVPTPMAAARDEDSCKRFRRPTVFWVDRSRKLYRGLGLP